MGDLFLIVLSFFSSLFSATVGMGGGLLLISFMPAFMPIEAVVPVHGVVQLGSNASRAAFAHRAVDWRVVGTYVIGAAVGAAAGSRLVVALPRTYLPYLLGVFILIVTWTPAARTARFLPGKFFALGCVQTFLGLFVGATGLLGPPVLLREGFEKDRLVATEAVFMSSAHLLKVAAFGVMGFVFRPYLGLLAGMVASVTAGSWAGTRLRARVPERTFRTVAKIVITLLALRLLVLP